MIDDDDTKNPMYAVSGGKKKEAKPKPQPMSQDAIMSEFAPAPGVVVEDEYEQEEPVTEKPLHIVPSAPVERITEGHKFDLPPRPPVRKKRNKKLRFTEIYTPITLNIDKRIAREFTEYLSQGDTMTSFSNQLALKILIDAGYDFPPDLLTKPPR